MSIKSEIAKPVNLTGMDFAVVDCTVLTEQTIVTAANGGKIAGIYVNTAIASDVVVIKLDDVTFLTLPAGTAAGAQIDLHDVEFSSTLKVDSGPSVSAGNFTFFYDTYSEL